MRIRIFLLLVIASAVLKAQILVKGKVVDEFNEPLPFVNVYMKGTTSGTTTDDEGLFSFTSPKNRGDLEVSFIGFHTEIIKITPKTQFLTIVLKEGVDVLDEVVLVTKPKKRLKKKENPAYPILKEIWKRKQKNGVRLVDSYVYKKHTSVEMGLNNIDTSFVRKVFEKDYDTAINQVQYDEDGTNYYLPIYLSEEVSKVYGNNRLNKKREDIEAEKSEGVGAQGFVFDRMANTFQNVDVFRNNIQLLQKSFVSPLSTKGFATYDYVLHDSIVKDNTTLYNVYFFPIREADLAFRGNFWVVDKTYSIKKMRMEVGKRANLNFVRGLTFEKEFEIINNNVYIPIKHVYEGDFTFLDKGEDNKGLTIKKTITFEDYEFGTNFPDEFYDQKHIKVRPDQFQKPESYWEKEGSADKKETYQLIANVKEKKPIKKLTGLLNTIASGYIYIPSWNLQLGPFWTALAQNEIEGIRGRLGFRTFKTKEDRFRLSGYVAYGFKDKEIKYGAEAKYLLSYKPRITTSLAYQKDFEQLGSTLLNTTQLLGSSFGSAVLFSRGNNYFLSDVEKYATNFDYAVHNNFHIGINLTRARINSASPENFSISYRNNSGSIESTVTNVASDIYVALTPGRFVYGLGVEQQFGTNIYPSIILNYTHGYNSVLGGTHGYNKIQFRYNQPMLLGKIGLLDATLEGGKTFGEIPISLLSAIPANQSYSLVPNTFSLLNYYDFVTDTYASAHLEHHFNGFILNRIPLLKRLKFRSLITFRGAYGQVSQENRDINDGVVNSYGTQNIIYNVPNKLYYEYGVGIENIGFGNMRFLRIDAIWRNNYSSSMNSIATPTPKFAFRIGVKTGL